MQTGCFLSTRRRNRTWSFKDEIWLAILLLWARRGKTNRPHSIDLLLSSFPPSPASQSSSPSSSSFDLVRALMYVFQCLAFVYQLWYKSDYVHIKYLYVVQAMLWSGVMCTLSNKNSYIYMVCSSTNASLWSYYKFEIHLLIRNLSQCMCTSFITLNLMRMSPRNSRM